jgi:hypothetical protein
MPEPKANLIHDVPVHAALVAQLRLDNRKETSRSLHNNMILIHWPWAMGISLYAKYYYLLSCMYYYYYYYNSRFVEDAR